MDDERQRREKVAVARLRWAETLEARRQKKEILAARQCRAEERKQALRAPTPSAGETIAASPGRVPGDVAKLAPYRGCGEPDFVLRGYYLDVNFCCVDCGAPGVWTAEQQKWCYEIAKRTVWSVARRCRSCREKECLRVEQARKTYLEVLRRTVAKLQG